MAPGPDSIRLLETIIEHLPAMVFVKDARELRFVLFNKEGEELLGIPRRALLGRTDYDLFPAQQADFFTEKDREVLATCLSLEIPEEEILSPMKGLRVLRTLKIPVFDEACEPRYLLGISQDISELKEGEIGRRQAEAALAQREAHYRSLLEYSSDLVVVVNASGMITYAGPSSERILGYSAEELVGRDVLADVHHEDQAEVRHALHSAIEDNTIRPRAEYRLRDKAGRWRILESTATNALANPAVSGVVVNSRDITERIKLQNQYMQAQRMEAVGSVAGGVAHDFNNLLSVVSVNAALLLDDLEHTDPRRVDAMAIVDAAESAGKLTSQLLAFSRRQVLRPVLLDLAAAVREMEPLVRRIVGEDVALETTLHDGFPPAQVFVDRGQFEQVILNLSVNAGQAMPGGGTLTIGVSVEDDQVRVEVGDTGMGMSEETRVRAFEPFFTTKAAGTGLGLATVYGIVRQSQGHITVQSERGQGTVFRIFLPLARGTGDPGEGPTTEVPRARPGETVLMVDDEPQVRATVQKLLLRLGYEVRVATDGDHALSEVLGPGRIDLLLTDIIMPRMRGTELAAHANAVRPGLPIVYMTAYSDSEKGIELTPAMRVVSKPLAFGPVARALRAALDSREVPAHPQR